MKTVRIGLLLLALLWLAGAGVGILRAQRAREDVQALTDRVAGVEREHYNAALTVERRLTAIETQLTRLNETTDWAVRGLFGSVALLALNSLWSVITAQRQSKRNTNP